MIDYSRMFTRADLCVICHQPRTQQGYADHAAMHLSRCEAVREVAYRRGGRIERVIPNTGHDGTHASGEKSRSGSAASPVTSESEMGARSLGAAPRALFSRPMDKKLQRIVRQHVARLHKRCAWTRREP